MTQVAFANWLGIENQPTYHRYESGDREPKTLLEAVKIAKKLGVSVEEMVCNPNPEMEFREGIAVFLPEKIYHRAEVLAGALDVDEWITHMILSEGSKQPRGRERKPVDEHEETEEEKEKGPAGDHRWPTPNKEETTGERPKN